MTEVASLMPKPERNALESNLTRTKKNGLPSLSCAWGTVRAMCSCRSGEKWAAPQRTKAKELRSIIRTDCTSIKVRMKDGIREMSLTRYLYKSQ